MLGNCAFRQPLVINESASTDRLHAQHNGHLTSVQYPSISGLFGVEPHTFGEFGSHPLFFIFPSTDLVLTRHSEREDSFTLDIYVTEARGATEKSVVHENFPEFPRCKFS